MTDLQWDSIWTNARIATMIDGYALIDNGAIAVTDEKICWVGKSEEVPAQKFKNCANKLDCNGQLVTPGLIDCHTHLIYGGNRASEFEQRLLGASYSEIAERGGGIHSTVTATRETSEEQLFQSAAKRLKNFLKEGVTTMEIKSGYGLNLESELKMLRVARRIESECEIDIETTFLGAHTVPKEYAGDGDAYISHLCNQVLPSVAENRLADCVDAYCESIAFSSHQIEILFAKARELKLPIKLHAEQLSDQKGALLAAKMSALSVDHLEYLNKDDVPHLKQNNTVAVLLPGPFYFLREQQLPPIDALRKHKVPIAIASDSNPGTSPTSSLLLMLNMACTLFRLTPEEALMGVTNNAAKALGKENEIGTIEAGKVANLVLWDTREPAELSYNIAGNPCQKVMYRGKTR